MFDTMTGTKIVGGFCGTLLVLLLAKWGGEMIYHVGPAGHGDGEHAQAYTIPVADTGSSAPAEEVDLGALFASGDVDRGQKAFGKCAACHKVDGTDGTGPHLNGVVDRGIGAVAGYAYSGAMAGHGGNWGEEELYYFLKKPSAYVPGTKMSFAGMPRDQEVADVIAFLKSKQ